METEAQLFLRVQQEIKRSERAKEKRKEIAKRSFIIWLQGKIAMVGRGLGVRLRINRKKLVPIWNWLMN